MWKGMIAIAIFVVAGSPAGAAHRLILCDTAQQIEQVFALHTEAITFEEAIDATNKQAGRPNACIKATVEATFLEEVRDITLGGSTYTIVKVRVTKVGDGERTVPVPLLEQFVMMSGRKEQGHVLDRQGAIGPRI
jgi:hypothetical protein